MTKLISLETVLIDVPLKRAHHLAMASMDRQSCALVIARCADGRIGVGEASTIRGASYVPESPETIKALIDAHIAPAVEGQTLAPPQAMLGPIYRGIVGNHFAKCAVETALFDLYAQSLGLPVSALLGGAVRRSVPVLWTLASGVLGQDIDEGEALLEARRHNIFKVKIGRRALDEDCAHITALADHFEGRATIRVDVNQGWTRLEAARGCAALADAGATLVEQPIDRDDLDGLADLARTAGIAIMADESINGPRRMFDIVKRRAGHAVSLKIAQAGGLIACRDAAGIARTGQMGLYGGTMLEGSIGTAASAQLFATIDRFEWDTELFGPLLQREDLAATPLVYEDFSLKIPDGPGIGLAPDWEKVIHFMREGQALDIPASATKDRIHAV